jgi:hypothetical protein
VAVLMLIGTIAAPAVSVATGVEVATAVDVTAVSATATVVSAALSVLELHAATATNAVIDNSAGRAGKRLIEGFSGVCAFSWRGV